MTTLIELLYHQSSLGRPDVDRITLVSARQVFHTIFLYRRVNAA
jgi:hypothetical protein